MNVASTDSIPPVFTDKKFYAWFLFVCLFWIVAISSKSLWLDEAHTASLKATQSISEWWRDDVVERGETQMPLYVFYLWGVMKWFGAREWALRAANLPWVFLGLWAWLRVAENSLKQSIALAAATSPFLWYYLNESRPYAMQIGSSFLIFAALQGLYKNSAATSGTPGESRHHVDTRFWTTAFCVGVIVLSGSNLLGAIWAGAFIATALGIFGWEQIKSIAKKNPLLIGVTCAVLPGLGLYYLWTLKVGGRGSPGKTDARNFIFIAYELSGFGGLGPGRLSIRENGLKSFRPYVVWLFAYAIFFAPIIFLGIRQAWRVDPKIFPGFALLFFGGGSVFLFLVGIFTGFRILGRHFSAASDEISSASRAHLDTTTKVVGQTSCLPSGLPAPGFAGKMPAQTGW